jgi:hypothetical protein
MGDWWLSEKHGSGNPDLNSSLSIFHVCSNSQRDQKLLRFLAALGKYSLYLISSRNYYGDSLYWSICKVLDECLLEGRT